MKTRVMVVCSGLLLLLGAALSASAQDVDVNVNVNVNVSVRIAVEGQGKQVKCYAAEPGVQVPLLFERTIQVKSTKWETGTIEEVLRNDQLSNLEPNERMEILKQGCMGSLEPPFPPREDMHVWVRRSITMSGWGTGTTGPARHEGLWELVSLPHVTLDQISREGSDYRPYTVQARGYKFVAVVRSVQLVSSPPPNLPPTLREYSADLWIGVFPDGVTILY